MKGSQGASALMGTCREALTGRTRDDCTDAVVLLSGPSQQGGHALEHAGLGAMGTPPSSGRQHTDPVTDRKSETQRRDLFLVVGQAGFELAGDSGTRGGGGCQHLHTCLNSPEPPAGSAVLVQEGEALEPKRH